VVRREPVSIADIALYGYTHCEEEGGLALSQYPAVSSWLQRVAGANPSHFAVVRLTVANPKSSPYIHRRSRLREPE